MNAERWQRVEQLYRAARQDRAALDKADPELRREVQALLAEPRLDTTVTQLGVGTQLGPYCIEAPLGVGGMGQVWRAVDTRLDRKVAIKICAQQFSERFEREARAVAALNHPHICTLHDVGPNYLVMELVEGETLAARLKKGALKIDLVLQYGGQIADALAAAHAKGIIHRDLKPGNVMITKSGVKVLDFGLAKTQRDETLTAANVVMGTPAYMAPEQKEGKECDARTDIYALGLVLREMATAAWFLRPAPPKPVTRLAIPIPPDQHLVLNGPAIGISPDGTRLVYVAHQGSVDQLYLRAMDGLDARAIPGTDGAKNPFFSPDGQWLGFYAGGKLKKVSLSGGAPVSLADVHVLESWWGATWSSQGLIAFPSELFGPVQQVSDAGGNVQPLTRLEKGEFFHNSPELLPGAKGLLFNTWTNNADPPKVVVQSLTGTDRRELLPAGNLPRYAPSGHMVYSLGTNLMAAPFDLGRLAITGAGVSVIEGVSPLQYSFSSTGSLAYIPAAARALKARMGR